MSKELAQQATGKRMVWLIAILAVIALFGFNNRWNDIMKTDLEQVVEDFLEDRPDALV